MLSRRNFLSAGAVAAAAARVGFASAQASAGALRPGCQANAWNLDPARFDLLLTALREMKQLGFAGFETNIRFLQPQLARLQESRAALQAIGLEFAGAHTSLPAYETLGAEGAAEAVAKLAAEARRFDARSLVVSHPGLAAGFTGRDLDAKAHALDLAGARAAQAGLVLAYHNHQPEFRNGAAEATALVRRTDPKRVSLMFDIGHAWLVYPEVISFFEAHHARVFGLHVRDFHNSRSVPLGQGEFPLKALAEAIRRTGWRGWLIDEEERPDEPDKPGIGATGPSRKTMRAIFGV